MARDLQNELAVPPLVHQTTFGWTLDRQSAKHEWPRGKAEILGLAVAIDPDELNRLSLPELLLGDQQIAGEIPSNLLDAL